MSVPAVARWRVGAVDRAPGSGPRVRGETWRRLLRSRSAVLGGSVLIVIVLAALAAALISPYDPIKTNQRLSLEGPSLGHLMGTDRFGRDIFSRVVWGGQESLPIGLVSVGIGLLFGVSLGCLPGIKAVC